MKKHIVWGRTAFEWSKFIAADNLDEAIDKAKEIGDYIEENTILVGADEDCVYSDVIGYLEADEVDEILDRISKL